MNLYLIRHTNVDVEPGNCCGQSDVGVAPTFQVEKDNLAEKLKAVEFDKIYSSPLFRCKILAKALFNEADIILDGRLKELNFGDWELKTWNDIYNSEEGKIWMDNYQTLSTLNGESYPEMVKRVSEFYADLIEEEHENVAVFTHAGVIRIFKSIINKTIIDVLFETFKPEYGSITEFKL